MSMLRVSKSRFTAHVRELLSQIERTGKSIVITDRDTPVLTVAPYRADGAAAIEVLRHSVVRYSAPTKPVGGDDWYGSR